MLQNQGVNKAILVGHVYGQPQWEKTEKDNYLCFQMVTNESFNRNQVLQEHFEHHFIRIPEQLAGNIEAELEDGMELHIEGKVNTRVSVDGGGIKRYDTGIIASKFSILAKSPHKVAIG